MQYQFLNIFFDQKDLLKGIKSSINRSINPFLLENNTSQIEKICNFYKNNANLLYVNGFLGTGKAEIVNYSIAFLSADTIILKYNCFNSTILDDILLSFFQEFKNLSSQNIISEPKIKTENFTQKINSYFSQIEKPFVIILDSFEAILDESRKEILDFILHLNSMPKVKIIIIGRSFENKYFENIAIERVTTLALERQIFEKYLKAEKIKAPNAILDEFYNHTRGYYFFIAISVKLMKSQKLSMTDFLTNLKNSFLSFDKFLGQQALTLVPATEKNLFWFLSVIRHPISIELLKKIDFYNEENLNSLIENMIVFQDNLNVYVQDYLKDEIDEVAPVSALQKIRQYIIDLYQTQLPLKPMERDICISRQTMRKEIEYHKLFLPKRSKYLDSTSADINYLSYSKVFPLNEKSKPDKEKSEVVKTEKPEIDLTQRRNISINLENLPFQNKPEKLFPQYEKNEQKEQAEKKDEEKLSFKEIIELILESEHLYEYAKIVDLCQKALQKVLIMKNESQYQSYLPFLYTKIAYAYRKIAEHEKALKYYDLVKNYYENKQDFTKVNQIKFHIANIFYETYRIEKAKELFLEISNDKQTSKNLIIKSYLRLASIEEGSTTADNALEYYELAMKCVSETTNEVIDEETLSELYFKYALVMDDKNNTKTAIDFYNKCINLNNNPKINKFLSPAYSNIATLCLERRDTESAIENYTKAFEIDKQTDNFEGVYDTGLKLASILQRKQPQKALEYLNIALDYAKQTKDIFYIISASLALGDYYYDTKKDEFALKYYLQALDMAQNSLSKDNIYKIDVRINDIKFRLGIEKFENLAEIIKEQEK